MATENSDTALLQKLARLWNGTDVLSEVDIATILWNETHNAHAYDRFGTKNVSFIEAIHSHNATIIPEIKSTSDLPPNTDEVILCTGYITAFPFLEPALTPHLHRERAYAHTFNLDIGPTLAFIGFARPAFGAVPPISELSARYWALLLTGELPFNIEEARISQISDATYSSRLFPRDANRLQSLVQYQRVMDTLASLIGCSPPHALLKDQYSNIHERVIRSSFCSAQFRLTGPGADFNAAAKILRSLPIPKYGRASRATLHSFLRSGDV